MHATRPGQLDPNNCRRWRLRPDGVLIVAPNPSHPSPRDETAGVVELWRFGRGSIERRSDHQSDLMRRLDKVFPDTRWFLDLR